MQEILNKLNKEQIEAVLYNDGPMLVLAGAGTGKTRVLTSKIAYIIKSNLAYPSQILAVTFTNKASNEMKERVSLMLNLDVSTMWLGTFHSIAVRVLRQYGDLINIDKNFTIIDQSEQTSLVKQIMKDLNIDIKEYPPKQYVDAIARRKDKISNNYDLFMFEDIFNKYQDKLKKSNMCDFSDLLLYNIELLSKHKEVKEYYNNKFKYILIDEYQDTNLIQNEWLKLISDTNNKNLNITCVGDDDQSIYGWRGAEIKNILKFKNDFKNAKIFKLERNYRSTQNILDAAYSIISNNKYRHEKKLFTNTTDNNNKVNLIKCNSGKQESIYIADEINNLKNKEIVKNYKQIAILVRAGYQTRSLEDIFMKYNIPYIIVGGLKFYERKEIKDCIAYLKIINNLNDDLAFERIINIPKRGIGSTTIDKIRDYSIENNISMFEASTILCNSNIIKGKTKEEIINFIKNINEWHNNIKNISLKSLMQNILMQTKFKEYIEKDDTIEAKNKIDNIEEFVNNLSDFENINNFLEYVSLVNDNNQKNTSDAVNILTIHAAKGLEFDVVFLPNWQEGVFPSPKSIEEKTGLEEERRLAYVAITRAKNNLYISYSKYKYEGGEFSELEQSRFIKELDKNTLNIIDNSNNSDLYHDYYNNKNKYLNKYKNDNFDYNIDYDNYKSLAEQEKDKINFKINSYVNIDNINPKNVFKKCYHKTFGNGYITKEDGNKLTIVFEKYGEKVILKDFVNIL